MSDDREPVAQTHTHTALFAHDHDAPQREHAGQHRHDVDSVHRPEARAATPAVPDFELDRSRLELLYRALAGRRSELVAWDAAPTQLPVEADPVHLPSRPPIDEHHGTTAREWYRVAVTHRAMHRLLGTDAVDVDRLAASYADPPLAAAVFATLEDVRVDAHAVVVLPGLAEAYRLACHEALHDRPPLSMLPARDAVVEALIQYGLGAAGVVGPPALDDPIARVVVAARRLTHPAADVTSTELATAAVYDEIAALPAHARHRSARQVTFADLVDRCTPPPADRRPPVGRAAVTVHPVPFREPATMQPANTDARPEVGRSQVLRPDGYPGRSDPASGDTGQPGTTDEGRQAPATDGQAGVDTAGGTLRGLPGSGDATATADAGGRLTARARNEFVYPEWDAVARRYRDRWCLVRTGRASAADRGHRIAADRHAHLLPGLVAALERVQPAGRDIVGRRAHGDDLDLDACIEALVDVRAGLEPNDRVWIASEDRRRDVVVAFAVDLSASTAQVLPPAADRAGTVSVLDLEREAVALVAAALERVGDAYGIYGFSGAGRDDVHVTVVKDVDERRAPGTLQRLAGLRPDHTTRMGAAVRHLTARLRRHPAATKVLLVVSDGRPFDIDYGEQYGEAHQLDYAVADTGAALSEARRAGVRPYLVTVDPDGGEYLSAICSPREYHVIGDARELPGSLADLYTVARADAFRSAAGASSK
ncbi:nitric oxide reductase activation protein NorD [uncultured Jatrophihabitans sp.]|uniref:nitric oxide reductase activation protein NorD n=1 Tax=uncultured Jatrophihabitans sp. TaxID=1610747 RepID=UPI0035CAC246